MNNTTKIVLGVMGAAAVGVALGMLLAPEKGSETRKKIGDSVKDMADQLSDFFAAGKEELNNIRNRVYSEAESEASSVQERFS